MKSIGSRSSTWTENRLLVGLGAIKNWYGDDAVDLLPLRRRIGLPLRRNTLCFKTPCRCFHMILRLVLALPQCGHRLRPLRSASSGGGGCWSQLSALTRMPLRIRSTSCTSSRSCLCSTLNFRARGTWTSPQTSRFSSAAKSVLPRGSWWHCTIPLRP